MEEREPMTLAAADSFFEIFGFVRVRWRCIWCGRVFDFKEPHECVNGGNGEAWEKAPS